MIGIDGGISDGNRILGNIQDMENRSMYYYQADDKSNKIWLPQDIIDNHFSELFKNNLKKKYYEQESI
jgi:hypothetical protein